MPARSAGTGYERLDLYPAYLAHLRALVDSSSFRPYRVVMDAANGVAGNATTTKICTKGYSLEIYISQSS